MIHHSAKWSFCSSQVSPCEPTTNISGSFQYPGPACLAEREFISAMRITLKRLFISKLSNLAPPLTLALTSPVVRDICPTFGFQSLNLYALILSTIFLPQFLSSLLHFT